MGQPTHFTNKGKQITRPQRKNERCFAEQDDIEQFVFRFGTISNAENWIKVWIIYRKQVRKWSEWKKRVFLIQKLESLEHVSNSRWWPHMYDPHADLYATVHKISSSTKLKLQPRQILGYRSNLTLSFIKRLSMHANGISNSINRICSSCFFYRTEFSVFVERNCIQQSSILSNQTHFASCVLVCAFVLSCLSFIIFSFFL